MEVGRELSGVPFGVPVGVVDALSTLALRDPDRGVIFELRKALTGVEISSLKDAFGVASDSADGPRLKLEAMRGGGDPTILGVSGAFVVLVEALRVGRSGRPLVLFCLSYAIVALPLRPVLVEQVCGTRIMALRTPCSLEHLSQA